MVKKASPKKNIGLYETLVNHLKNNNNFVDEDGQFKKWVVINKARDHDEKLIEYLLESPALKKIFFIQLKNVLIFNQNLFVEFLELKNYLADSYTKHSVNIGLSNNRKLLKQSDDVALVWPHKDCLLEGGQSTEENKRDEIFFNEILAKDEITQLLDPKVFTNFKVFNKTKQNNFNRDKALNEKRDLPQDTITDNLIIKGNNLLALHSLKEQFAGKIKLIYIDPPYNPNGAANTFTYNNNFNHSTWLTFMKNRLEVGKKLLRNDGFIAIAIDHNELFYLGNLADEIFERDNRLGIVTVVHNPKGRYMSKFFSENTEFMLVYAKYKSSANFNNVVLDEDKKKLFNLEDKQGKYRLENFIRARTETKRENKPKHWYPLYVSNDLKYITSDKIEGYNEVYPNNKNGDFTWKTVKESFNKKNSGDYFIAVKEGEYINIFHKYYEQQVLKNFWNEKRYQSEFNGTNLLKKYFGRNVFSYPKSLYTVLDTLKLMTNENDIILDFFAGSGTTGHATLALNKEDGGNRKFILVEQLDKHIDVCIERNQKVLAKENIDDSFVCVELKKYNQIFMYQIKNAKDSKALLKIWKSMKDKSFINYNVDIKKQDKHIEDFKNLKLNEQKRMLCALLDKNQMYVNLSSLDDTDFECTDKEKHITIDFYQKNKKIKL